MHAIVALKSCVSLQKRPLTAGGAKAAPTPELAIWFLSADEPDACSKMGVTLPLSSIQGGLAFTAPVLETKVVLPVQVGVHLR
jgi:hypothetical protein